MSIDEMPASENTPPEAWYCVQVKNKKEHLVANLVSSSLNLETWCPRIKYRKATLRGMMWFQEALFPTYFFAKFNPDTDFRKIQYTQGVTKIIRFGDRLVSVPQDFIKKLQEEIKEGNTLVIPNQIIEGDEVQIVEGSMRGLQALVHQVLPAKERVKVLMEILGEVREIEIPMHLVQQKLTAREALNQTGYFLPET